MKFASWKRDVGYIPEWLKRPDGDPFIAVWGAKWRGEDKVVQGVVTPAEARKTDDKRAIKPLIDMIRQADIVLGHNMNRHDLPIVRGRALLHRLPPLPPVNVIDTLAMARRDFGLPYNGMESMCELAGIPTGEKIGMTNWHKVLDGDKEALTKLKHYNYYDVEGSENLFEWMLPYVSRLQRLVGGPGSVCPTCDSAKLQKRGLRHTAVSTYQRYECMNCGRYTRAKSLAEMRLPWHPL